MHIFRILKALLILAGLPSVLVPSFHLGVSQVQFGGKFHPVLNAQVLLPLEAALQGLELVIGECGP